MIFNIVNPSAKDLNKKQLYNIAIKAFKNTLNNGVSTHIYNNEYSISIDSEDDVYNSCYIDLNNLYFRQKLKLKEFKRVIKHELDLLFKE